MITRVYRVCILTNKETNEILESEINGWQNNFVVLFLNLVRNSRR